LVNGYPPCLSTIPNFVASSPPWIGSIETRSEIVGQAFLPAATQSALLPHSFQFCFGNSVFAEAPLLRRQTFSALL
jgi:hypothetical protein